MKNGIKERVDAIIADKALSAEEKAARLTELYEYARSEQRTASESAMVSDDGLNDALRAIELGLEKLGVSQPLEKHDKSAATL